MKKLNFLGAIVMMALLTTNCNNDDEVTLSIIEASETELQLDPLDKGGRWLVSAMEETTELDLSDDQKATLTNHFNDLALDSTLRCDEAANDDFVESITSYPQEAIDLVQDTHTRLCSDLNLHDGYWLYETEDPGSGVLIQNILDVQVDAATKRMTVYAQLKVDGTPFQPAQVGPGSTTTTLTGEMAGHHPNAVYLDGSGEEFLEDVGGGSWWVKHSWVVDGEGYQNWPLEQFALEGEYGPGTYAEGILLEDGLSVKIGDLDGSETGQYNIRQPITNTNPVSFHISSYPDAESSEPVTLAVSTITENPSPFDGLARFSHASTGNEPVAEPFSLQAEVDESVDYEIFQTVSDTETIVWANIDDITQSAFDALELPDGWTKNQPREALWDGGEFTSSPGQEEGVKIVEELFGFQWQHVATVGAGYPIDAESILFGSDVYKNHIVFYNQGTTVKLVVSNEGEIYVLGTRDFNRTSDVATLPEGWQNSEFVAESDLQLQLPNPTVNIRADNQDSFQGPITEDDFEPRQ